MMFGQCNIYQDSDGICFRNKLVSLNQIFSAPIMQKLTNHESIALERATQTSLLRFHLQNTRTEQESYLQSVEKARVSNAIESKAETRREGKKLKLGEESVAVVEKKASGRERSYRQREVVDVAGKSKKSNGNGKQDLDSVLDSLF